MIVADTSAVVELLLGGTRGRMVEAHLLDERDRIQAPALLDAEVVQALRRLVATGVMGQARGAAAVEIFRDLPISRHFMSPLIPRMWELRPNLTAYDAAYVALAEALACPLLTFDHRIAGAPGHRARVLVPGR
ncbi:MAG: type II toxin-antitoxin system VapC family toxin [Longimicrobiales bacterium]|nr:type II toxin-antitoxin system VapC family toxin [Longimicrobiales bacterium]